MQGIVSAFVVRIPVAYFMSIRFGTLFAIGLSVPISTFSQIVMCFIFFAMVQKKERARTQAAE